MYFKVLFMEKNPSSADELKTIRRFMQESTKFLSLSGLSGIFPGIFALIGAFIAWLLILMIRNDIQLIIPVFLVFYGLLVYRKYEA